MNPKTAAVWMLIISGLFIATMWSAAVYAMHIGGMR